MNLQFVKWFCIVVGALYFFSWIDIIPDRIHPLIGRLDDFIFLGFLAWRYYKLKKKIEIEGASNSKNSTQHATESQQRGDSSARAAENSFDPYRELEISRGASMEEIDSAYKKLMTQYHPDKVHHLGPELKKVAHEKTLAIQRAYEALKKQ